MELLPNPGHAPEDGRAHVLKSVEQCALERALVSEVDGVVGGDADEDVDDEAGDVAERQVAYHPLAVAGNVVDEAARRQGGAKLGLLRLLRFLFGRFKFFILKRSEIRCMQCKNCKSA